MRRLKARNRSHGTHTHGGTSGINGHGDIGGEAQGSLSAARNGNWELGGGSRMGMGWEEPKGPAALFFQPKLSPSPSPTAAAAAAAAAAALHFTSLHFPLTASSSAPASASSIARGGSAACVCICSILLVDGMLWSMLWDGMGEKSIECRGGEESKRRSKSAPGPRARDPDRG